MMTCFGVRVVYDFLLSYPRMVGELLAGRICVDGRGAGSGGAGRIKDIQRTSDS
jgi:hypothetical protein